MRALVIAYEFPPSPSPQSLRWMYLTRELAEQGVDVHVLTVDPPPTSMLRSHVPAGVEVHRVFPGFVVGGVAWLAKRKRASRKNVAESASSTHVAATSAPARLNWKGRLVESIQRFAAHVCFPDLRGEWRPFASRRLHQLLDELRPDVVVSSHEPATTLQLGALAKARGFRWLADLGDPVLSFYTPERWRAKSLGLERRTCKEADLVTVTTAGARAVLIDRHRLMGDRVRVLTQGYDARPTEARNPVDFDPQRLELLFTGSLYSFRNPEALLDGLLACDPSVRLNIATSRWPESLEQWLVRHPERLRLLGFLPHEEAVAAQRAADVLVNIANDDPIHLPGKIFEYLGARRPILHLGDDPSDAGAAIVAERKCGWRCQQHAPSIASALSSLAALKRQGRLDNEFNLQTDGLERYSWQGIGRQLHGFLADIGRGGPA